MQRYGSGIGNYLDVLSVEQQLLQALGGGFAGDTQAAALPSTSRIH
ncbi:hypothetical protein NLX68_04770 [Pseudomonas sp. SBB6]|nr:hypothetical protein [Pseudomonas sp. SBB6]